jgi:hypothetical protein
MWTYCGLRIREGRGWTDNDGVKHPAQWTRWTLEQKQAKGLVWEDDPVQYDSRFYTGDGTPKALEDVNVVDDNGDAVLDFDGNPVITKGLKSQAIAQTKVTAGSLLSGTDWYVTRKAETDTDIPSEVLTYREAVRNASGAIETAIKACTTLDQFKALYDAPVNDEGVVTGNAPINDWPEAI